MPKCGAFTPLIAELPCTRKVMLRVQVRSLGMRRGGTFNSFIPTPPCSLTSHNKPRSACPGFVSQPRQTNRSRSTVQATPREPPWSRSRPHPRPLTPRCPAAPRPRFNDTSVRSGTHRRAAVRLRTRQQPRRQGGAI